MTYKDLFSGDAMQSISVGIRDAKVHLSKLLKMVKQGAEITLTDRNRPVGKIVPIQSDMLSLADRIQRLEDRGAIGEGGSGTGQPLPPPIPISGGIAQKLLAEDRDHER